MATNLCAPPTADVTDVGAPDDTAYAGFWIRALAALIDRVLELRVIDVQTGGTLPKNTGRAT